MIPESFIQELLSRIDIVEVINKVVPLKRTGKNYMACCPFHREKTPSFSVSPQNDGRSVSVSVGDMGVIFPAGPFINMYLDIGTSIIPKLRPEPGSVKIPSIPYMMSGTIPETPKPTEKEQDGLDHDTCPCCGARDLWTFEDGPQDIVVTCNKCGMSGSGRNRTEAMANLASKKGVSQ